MCTAIVGAFDVKHGPGRRPGKTPSQAPKHHHKRRNPCPSSRSMAQPQKHKNGTIPAARPATESCPKLQNPKKRNQPITKPDRWIQAMTRPGFVYGAEVAGEFTPVANDRTLAGLAQIECLLLLSSNSSNHFSERPQRPIWLGIDRTPAAPRCCPELHASSGRSAYW